MRKSFLIVGMTLLTVILAAALCACDGMYPWDFGSVTTTTERESVTYTVYFDAQNGEDATEISFSGSSAYCPDAKKAGYVFDGWYKDKAFTGSPLSIVKPSDFTGGATEMVLYAKYRPEISVTYRQGEKVLATNTCGEGDELQTIDKSGYAFRGWYKNEDLTQLVTKATENMTVYGKYVPCYAVIYDLKGGRFNEEPAREICEDETLTLPTPEYDRKAFLGWETEDGETISVLQNVTQDVSLVANWGKATYNIHWDANGVDADVSSLPSTYTEGTGLIFRDVTAPGKIFCGWYDGGTRVTSLSGDETGDRSFTAKWVDSSYTLVKNGWVVKGGDKATADYGSVLDKTVAVNDNAYTFNVPSELSALAAEGRVRATFSCTLCVTAQTAGDCDFRTLAYFRCGGEEKGAAIVTASGGGYSGGIWDITHTYSFVTGAKVTNSATFSVTRTLTSSVSMGYRYQMQTNKTNALVTNSYEYSCASLTCTLWIA